MTYYPYASNAKIQASMDAIGAAFIGSQEVTILKQVLVGVTNGGITPPFEPIVITAPDGAYAGAPLIITGGVYAIYAAGEYVLAVDDQLPAVQVYQFVINGVPVGDWVTSPTTIPYSVVEGDLIQVQDISGNLSNTLIGLDPLFNIPMAFRFQTHNSELMPPAQAVRVVGAGTSSVNGLYMPGPITNGQPSWVFGSNTIFYDGLEYTLDINGSGEYTRIGIDPPWEGSWEVGFGSDAPPPTMTIEMVQQAYRDCIVVSGAGTEAANGRYYGYSSYLTNFAGYALGHNLGFGDAWYLAPPGGGGFLYQSTPTSDPDITSVESVTWSVLAGDAPAPTFTYIREPQYQPLGLYTAPDFLTPAQMDQQVGGWKFPGKPVTVTESNLMLQPTLRNLHGVPVLEFDGDGLVSTETAQPYTAFTALVRLADASDTAHRTILGFELNGINWRINKPGSGDIALQSSAGGHGQHMCTYLWTTDVVIITVTIGVSGCSIFVDGIELPIDQSTLIDITEFGGYFTLGRMHQEGDPWDGDFITAYGYNAADRLKVEAYCETLKGGVL